MRLSRPHYRLASGEETRQQLGEDNPDWNVEKIEEKTGICRRFVSTEGESALTLAIDAGRLALEEYEWRDQIDGLVYVTQSPDSRIPATACLLHEALELPGRCAAFDVNQGCSGFVYGLAVANSLQVACGLRHCLVVCSETYTKYITRDDRTNRPIFSDGASAVVVGMEGSSSVGPFLFLTDGSGAPNLTLKRSAEGGEILFMDGPKVLGFTMSAVPRAVRTLLEQTDLSLEDVDLFFFHQASKLVIDNLCRLLRIEDSRVVRNYEAIGNTVASTIPIALRGALDSGRLRPGMTTLLIGFGVGYSLAACVYRP